MIKMLWQKIVNDSGASPLAGKGQIQKTILLVFKKTEQSL